MLVSAAVVLERLRADGWGRAIRVVAPLGALVVEGWPALVMAMRNILVETRAPAMSLMLQLGGVSILMFLFGWTLFKLLKRRFYEFL